MVKLKTEVNKSKVFRELEKYADEVYEGAWESEYAKVQFIEGAKHLFDLLRLPVVTKSKPLGSSKEMVTPESYSKIFNTLSNL